MRIGIFGGSFNPVHNEHINMCKAAIEKLKLDKLIVVPAYIPPHKAVKLAPPKDRLQMLKLAFNGVSGIEISDYELTKDETSFTYITVSHFKEIYKSSELFFLVGADMLLDFPTWRFPEKILDCVTLFVTSRCGETLLDAENEYSKHFNKPFIVSDYIGKKVSSTKIKTYIKCSFSVKEYIPQAVEEYIIAHKLYDGGRYYDYVKSVLTEKRFRHTAGVIILATTYAKRLKLNLDKAELAALLHDSAKYQKPESYPDFKLEDDVPIPVVHQFLGAYVAEKVLNVDDIEIINAIKYHSTGKANMTQLEKVVFLADLLEEGRDFPDVDTLRSAVDKGFESGFRYAVSELTRFLMKSGEPIYRLTLECNEYYNNLKN